VYLGAGGVIMGKPSWRIQIYRALNTIDHIGHSKYEAKQEQDWIPGQAVKGLYSFGYRNLVFDQAITFTNWLHEEYPDVRLFSDVDREMVAEYLGEKAETCTPDTIRTRLATLKKLQEGLRAMNWIHEEIVPQDWAIDGRNPPRGPYAPDEATAISEWITQRDAEYGQALNFILSSGARIDETLHLRSDKVFVDETRVELQGKGGRVRKIHVLHADALKTLDLSRRFVYLTEQPGRLWKDGLERRVRQACDALDIRRRGVHGFRATAACEFVNIRGALGVTEIEARHELAMWLGHNPHRTEVTYAYVPKIDVP
jgi:integrase